MTSWMEGVLRGVATSLIGGVVLVISRIYDLGTLTFAGWWLISIGGCVIALNLILMWLLRSHIEFYKQLRDALRKPDDH